MPFRICWRKNYEVRLDGLVRFVSGDLDFRRRNFWKSSSCSLLVALFGQGLLLLAVGIPFIEAAIVAVGCSDPYFRELDFYLCAGHEIDRTLWGFCQTNRRALFLFNGSRHGEGSNKKSRLLVLCGIGRRRIVGNSSTFFGI